MAKPKKLPPRKRLKVLFPFLHSLGTAAEPVPSPKSERLARRIDRVLRRPLRKAFKEANLNIDDHAHRDQLLVWLAWAVYGGKRVGAPRIRTSKKLLQFFADFQAVQAKNPGMKDTPCCRLLSEGKEAEGRYKGRNVDTLRRFLYDAKRFAQTAEVMATPLKEVIATPEAARLAGEKTRRKGQH
jgi:hypothetical protein